MSKNIGEKKFLTNGSITQEDVDKIVYELRIAGMSEKDIALAGEHKGWFRLNKNYTEKLNEAKGKKQ